MIITAKASHLSHTPRKVNLVAKSIVGLPAEKALDQLQFTLKRASNPVSLVLKQAIANATHNFQLSSKDLIVARAFATKGRTLKKGLFGGRMRFKPIEKTASHLTIELKSKEVKPVTVKSVKAPAKQANPSNKSNSTNKSKISNVKSTIK